MNETTTRPGDARIRSAVAHWAPRFVANGVIPSDLAEVTGGLARWEDWCGAWSSQAELHEALGRAALDGGHALSAGAISGEGRKPC